MRLSNKYEKVIRSIYEYGVLSLQFQGRDHGTQWFVLDLECGHRVGRYCRPQNETPPKHVRCEYCEGNEVARMKNYDYTSDEEGWCRNQETGYPKP